MMGNSHLRNLFRCTVEFLRDTVVSLGRKPWWSDDDGLKCTNTKTTHGEDYEYEDETYNIAGHDLWTVFWHDYNCTEAEMRRPYCDKTRSYVGSRYGIDDLNTTIIPSLEADKETFLIFNFNSAFNNRTAKALMTRLNQLSPAVKQRVILIMDPFGAKTGPFELSDDELGILNDAIDAGIIVFHFRKLYGQYFSQVGDGSLAEDVRGTGDNHGHLYIPLNHFLIRFIFSHILYIRGLSSPATMKLLRP